MAEVSWRQLRDELSRTTWRDWARAIAAVAGLCAFVTFGVVIRRVFGSAIQSLWLVAGLLAVVIWSKRRRR